MTILSNGNIDKSLITDFFSSICHFKLKPVAKCLLRFNIFLCTSCLCNVGLCVVAAVCCWLLSYVTIFMPSRTFTILSVCGRYTPWTYHLTPTDISSYTWMQLSHRIQNNVLFIIIIIYSNITFLYHLYLILILYLFVLLCIIITIFTYFVYLHFLLIVIKLKWPNSQHCIKYIVLNTIQNQNYFMTLSRLQKDIYRNISICLLIRKSRHAFWRCLPARDTSVRQAMQYMTVRHARDGRAAPAARRTPRCAAGRRRRPATHSTVLYCTPHN